MIHLIVCAALVELCFIQLMETKGIGRRSHFEEKSGEANIPLIKGVADEKWILWKFCDMRIAADVGDDAMDFFCELNEKREISNYNYCLFFRSFEFYDSRLL